MTRLDWDISVLSAEIELIEGLIFCVNRCSQLSCHLQPSLSELHVHTRAILRILEHILGETGCGPNCSTATRYPSLSGCELSKAGSLQQRKILLQKLERADARIENKACSRTSTLK